MGIVHWSKNRGFIAKVVAVLTGLVLMISGLLGGLVLVALSFAPPEGRVRAERSVYQFVKSVEPSEYAAVRDSSGLVVYPIWVRADAAKESVRPAVESPVTDTILGARRVWMKVEPGRLVTWLDESVYRGSLVWLVGWSVLLELATFGVLLAAGKVWDWMRRKRAMDGIYKRGARLVSLRKWNRKSIGPWWIRQKVGMGIRVSANGGRAWVSLKKMTTHMAHFIKTGGGKTIINTEVLRIAAENDWVVIASGSELAKKFYRAQRGDYIIDPTYARCASWATEREIVDPISGRGLTAGIFPIGRGENSFFVKAVQEGLASILHNYSVENAPKMDEKDPANTKNLAKWLRNPGKHIMKRSKGTSIAAKMNPKSGDQFAGMEGSFASAADGFAMMPGPGEGWNEFCAREWVQMLNSGEQPGWIFFPAAGVTENAIKPVTTAILNYILALLRDGKDDVTKRRQLVIVLDEIVTNFNFMDEFEAAITNLRKFGVMILFGVHAVAALREVYGNDKTEVIVGQPGLQFVGPTDSKESAEYASGIVGKQEVWVLETNFNKQDGDAHRHSVGYRLDTKERTLVMADSIRELSDRHGFLRSGGMIVKVVLSYRSMPEQAFEPRIVPFHIDDDPDEQPAQAPGVPPKNEPVAKIDGGPPVPYSAMQPQIEAAVAAEAKQRKMLRVLAFINTQKRGGQGSLTLVPSVRDLRRQPAGVSR